MGRAQEEVEEVEGVEGVMVNNSSETFIAGAYTTQLTMS